MIWVIESRGFEMYEFKIAKVNYNLEYLNHGGSLFLLFWV